MLTDLKANVAAGGDSMLPADGRWMVVGGWGVRGKGLHVRVWGKACKVLSKKS